MLTICADMILKISEFLTDREKITLTMVCVLMDRFKYKFTYCEKINICNTYLLPYFDNFEYVQISATPDKYPKKLKHIFYEEYGNIYDDIPPSVTHLTLDWGQEMHKKVPSVTYVTMHGFIYPSTLIDIPSVTHLEICVSRNTSINKKYIPSSVTHLMFGKCFNQRLENCIPSTVTHLKFCASFNMSMDIPPSVVEISIPDTYGHEINQDIMSRVKIIKN